MVRSQTRTLAILLLFASAGGVVAQAGRWPQIPVLAGPDDQEHPDIHGTTVVWQEFVSEFGDYDIYVVDVNDLDNVFFTVLGNDNDQTNPAVYGRRVVWQELVTEQETSDWDIRMADVTDFEAPVGYVVTGLPGNDEERPAIHGNVIVWQDTNGVDYDVYGADITDPCAPLEFAVAAFEFDQKSPSIYRDTVVWQDNLFGDWDLLAADIWLQDRPTQFPATADPPRCAQAIAISPP